MTFAGRSFGADHDGAIRAVFPTPDHQKAMALVERGVRVAFDLAWGEPSSASVQPDGILALFWPESFFSS